MAYNTIISLNDVDPQVAAVGGGKFAGLSVLNTLIPIYNVQYNTDFIVLETYGRTSDFENIREGDYMVVNMVTGEFTVIPKSQKER